MMSEDGVEYDHDFNNCTFKLKIRLFPLVIGQATANLLKIFILNKKEADDTGNFDYA